LNDRSRLAVMAEESRRRAVEQFSYDALSAQLATVLGCG